MSKGNEGTKDSAGWVVVVIVWYRGIKQVGGHSGRKEGDKGGNKSD